TEPNPTWGNMINGGQLVLREAPWLTFFPGLAIVLTVLAFNLLGDAIRDALDPAVRDLRAPSPSLDATLPSQVRTAATPAEPPPPIPPCAPSALPARRSTPRCQARCAPPPRRPSPRPFASALPDRPNRCLASPFEVGLCLGAHSAAALRRRVW